MKKAKSAVYRNLAEQILSDVLEKLPQDVLLAAEEKGQASDLETVVGAVFN